MKIAMLGHKRVPSREGGVEVVVEELSTRMVARGHQVALYSRAGHNVAGAEFDEELFSQYKGVAIKQVPTLDVKGLAALTSSYFATKAAIADAPDVIHFHAEGPCAMIPLAKKAGIRTVATIHGLDWQRAKWGKFASWYIKQGEVAAAKHADEIVVLSKNVQDYFENEYGRETHFIPNGVVQAVFQEPSSIQNEHDLSKGNYVLFLGRIVPEKGLHYLIEAYKNVSTDKRLIIAGGSSDSREYFNNVRQQAAGDPRIQFIGFTQGRKLAELFSNAAVYVLPSDLEGMPMSLLEAMSYGSCCLTSNIPECATVLANTGAVFKKGDVEDLSNKLQSLLDAPSKASQLGAMAKERVLANYNWESIVDQTLRLYEGA